jgi:Domain of Unknown Function (DUF1259)
MKTIVLLFLMLISINQTFGQQDDWSAVEKVFGKKGAVQDGVFKIVFPRYDLQVRIGDFIVAPGLALGSWMGFMKMGDHAMVMGDLVLLEKEVTPVISKLVSENVQITALHNHLIGETPAVKYIHFEAKGDAVNLAEKIMRVLSITATPLSPPPPPKMTNPDWTRVEAILGTTGKHNGNLLQYSFPRKETLRESEMEMPAYMGMATGINFQMDGDRAAITGDFVLTADEVNPVVKALTENGIAVTAIHNHMLYDNPRLFMIHFWAVDNPEKLAKGLKAALDKTNSKM